MLPIALFCRRGLARFTKTSYVTAVTESWQMHVELDEAIKIYAQACRAWYGKNAHKKVLAKASWLRVRGDAAGARVWQRVADEVARAHEPAFGSHFRD